MYGEEVAALAAPLRGPDDLDVLLDRVRGARVVLLDDLFVADASRGAGHADALIEATAEVARRYAAPLVVWFTQVTNHRAQAVYNRVGGSSAEMLEYQLTL